MGGKDRGACEGIGEGEGCAAEEFIRAWRRRAGSPGHPNISVTSLVLKIVSYKFAPKVNSSHFLLIFRSAFFEASWQQPLKL
jgi:hypothetical protein